MARSRMTRLGYAAHFTVCHRPSRSRVHLENVGLFKDFRGAAGKPYRRRLAGWLSWPPSIILRQDGEDKQRRATGRQSRGRNKMRFSVLAGALCATLLLVTSASAQAPTTPAAPPSAGGTPEKMPFDIPYGQSIGEEKAKQVLAAAEGKKRNWKMNIAVVDTNGELVHFLRMDGAQIASVNVFIGKARTAARFRREARSDPGRFSWRVPVGFGRQAHWCRWLQRRHRRSRRSYLQGRS